MISKLKKRNIEKLFICPLTSENNFLLFQKTSKIDYLKTEIENKVLRMIMDKNKIKESGIKENIVKINPNIKKYEIKNNLETNVVNIPADYIITDEDEFRAINLLNEIKDLNNGWKDCSKKNSKIFLKFNKKENSGTGDEDTLIISLETELNYNSDFLMKLIDDYDFLKDFETPIKDGNLIKKNEDIKDLIIYDLYLFIKMPLIFDNRDFTVRKKCWFNHANRKGYYLSHLKSVELKDYPPKPKIIRGSFYDKAIYLTPLNENSCKLNYITHMDMKMSMKLSWMQSSAVEGQLSWLKDLIKYADKHK